MSKKEHTVKLGNADVTISTTHGVVNVASNNPDALAVAKDKLTEVSAHTPRDGFSGDRITIDTTGAAYPGKGQERLDHSGVVAVLETLGKELEDPQAFREAATRAKTLAAVGANDDQRRALAHASKKHEEAIEPALAYLQKIRPEMEPLTAAERQGLKEAIGAAVLANIDKPRR